MSDTDTDSNTESNTITNTITKTNTNTLQGGVLQLSRTEGPILLQNVTAFNNVAGVDQVATIDQPRIVASFSSVDATRGGVVMVGEPSE